jgi:peptide subunit release factor 1 (eRF1)
VRWKNARRAAEQTGWPADRLNELDAVVDGLEHDHASAFVIVQAADGAHLEETLGSEIAAASVSVDEHPRLLTILDSRQRTLPHIVVVTDRAGADIVTFEGSAATATSEVEGERLHIHRGHPGGWSQRRFQQRAENTWEVNADSVVEAVLQAADRAQPALIAVAGDVRAKTLVERGLSERTDAPVALLDSGDPDGIADEVIRLVDDQHARFLRRAIERLREAAGSGNAPHGESVLDALRAGRVDALLVHDVDDHDQGSIDALDVGSLEQPHDRLVDRAIVEALDTAASVVVIPNVAELSDGVAATLRW